ncbi:MAG: AAA family ATPase [Capsulimonadaceae bacterium]
MEGKVFLKSLSLNNLLSFGPEGVEVELQPLNVLIGANGSGKSNFINAISLLRSTPGDIASAMAKGGGPTEYQYNGASEPMTIAATIDNIGTSVKHTIALITPERSLRVEAERIELISSAGPVTEYEYAAPSSINARFHVSYPQEEPDEFASRVRESRPAYVANQVTWDRSVLAQRGDPTFYPTLWQLREFYESIRVYKDWRFGSSAPRERQPSNLRADTLDEGSQANLAHVLSRLRRDVAIRNRIVKHLSDLLDDVSDFSIELEAGSVWLSITHANHQVSAPRLSDGTVRFLCLLAVLCDPNPPPLVCIEEPELGMHPDIISTIAKLLIEASQRMQLIVTTHSEMLVNDLRDVKESILVCDRYSEGTEIKRLDPDELKSWLSEYSLGETWMRGGLGGTRW